ncbi:MAG TPA: sulfatase-like hydrolase/transferase [Tepidisphaeraceae bacterium]|jgi:arylsulfatase A-like enzyme
MRKSLLLALSLTAFPGLRAQAKSTARGPNVIFILCDDMGYGDFGANWQNQRGADEPRLLTPNLDEMSSQGMRLTSHYSSCPVCAPSRASLLTGLNQGHCDLRDNEFDKPLVPGPTLGNIMQTAGYYTAAIGKWGVGGKEAPWPAHPLKRGFNEYYGVLRHGWAHDHYADNNGHIYDGYNPITSGLTNAYDNDLYTARAKKFVEDRAHQDKPFFLYLAFTLPHFGMQLPPGPYPKGGGLHGGVLWPLDESHERKNSYVFPAFRDQDWPKNEKTFASMIHRIDDNVGDLMQLLKDERIDGNTLVVFTSDNGPHNEGNDPRFFGSWGPFDGIKRDLFEGGMREPTIVRWPGHVPANSTSDEATVQYDWMATFADLVNLPSPAFSDGISILPTITGRALQQRHHPYLYFEYMGPDVGPVTKEILARHNYTTRGQMQAVRVGDMVGVRYDIQTPDDPLELYNVKTDLHENHNLASDPQYAPVLAQMRTLLVTSRDPVADAPRPYDNVPMPAVDAPQSTGAIVYRNYDGHWPWIPDFQVMQPTNSAVVQGLTAPPAAGTEYVGFIHVASEDKYTFTANHNIDLWVHDGLVIRDTDAEQDGSVRLTVGWHPIRIASTSPDLRLSLSSSQMNARPITADMLGYNPNQIVGGNHN